MSSSQKNFLKTLHHLRLAFNNPALNAELPVHSDHNSVSKILRNGMAVVGFVALEDYLKKRTGEVLGLISNSGRKFNDLPFELQYATTRSLINSLPHLLKLQDSKIDKVDFIINQANKIASTSQVPFSLSEYSFGYNKSNISYQDVSEILKAFIIKDSWNQMSEISARLGFTAQNLVISFKNLSERRHSAAHDINANTPINDLIQYLTEAIGIAISFDALLTKAYKYIESNHIDYLKSKHVITADNIKLSTIKLIDEKWKYKREINTIASRSNIDKLKVVNYAKNFSAQNNETLVIFNENGVVEKWICN